MKLVLIHGINNVGTPVADRLASWRRALIRGGTAADRIDAVMPVMPDYARLLRDGQVRDPLGPSVPVDQAKLAFMAQCMGTMLRHWNNDLGASLAAIDPATDTLHAARLYGQMLGGATPPRFGDIVEIIDEIYDYLTKPALRSQIDAIVAAALTGEQLIVVGHSLGAVVGWRLLRSMGASGIDLGAVHFATLGAPFPIPALRAVLDAPFQWPATLGSWINLYHPLDYVSLGSSFRLAAGGPQPKHHRIVTDERDPHDHRGYLAAAPLRNWLDRLLVP